MVSVMPIQRDVKGRLLEHRVRRAFSRGLDLEQPLEVLDSDRSFAGESMLLR